MIIINTQAIVLKAVRYKENDVILTLFTRKLGKVAAIARGAKRSKSPFLASSQLFAYSNFHLKKQSTMYLVNQADIIKSFYDISYDFDAFSYATYVTKLVEDSMLENQTNNRLFVLLAQTLYLYTQKDLDYEFITIAFELKYLDYLGFRPVVNRCVNCQSKNLDGAVFNIDEGGILCKKCSEGFIDNIKLDLTTIKLMEYILSNDITICSKAKVSKFLVYELKNLLQKYMYAYLDKIDKQSLKLLQSINSQDKRGQD
jgi:DNA repair protein RecO (recombination protein O)